MGDYDNLVGSIRERNRALRAARDLLLPRLMSGKMDVSRIPDLVPGYVITSQGQVGSNLLPLQSTWFFDGVESSGHMKFIKRGGASV